MLLELADVSSRDRPKARSGRSARPRQSAEEEKAAAAARVGRGQAEDDGQQLVEGRHREKQAATEGDLQAAQRFLPASGNRKPTRTVKPMTCDSRQSC